MRTLDGPAMTSDKLVIWHINVRHIFFCEKYTIVMLSITRIMYIDITIVTRENILFLHNVKIFTGTQAPALFFGATSLSSHRIFCLFPRVVVWLDAQRPCKWGGGIRLPWPKRDPLGQCAATYTTTKQTNKHFCDRITEGVWEDA